MATKLTLLLGGARSGKSTYAQKIVEGGGGSALFVATATAGDKEMKARIAAHRTSRPRSWVTLEAPMNLSKEIEACAETQWVLVDCITLLVSNILLSCPEPIDEMLFQKKLRMEIDSLIETVQLHQGNWVMVSNEVGMGLVPAYALGRFYRDGLGWANQRLAEAADEVYFMVAGIPMKVKSQEDIV